MIPIIMMLFGISTLGQFQLEIPEFLPDQVQLFVKKWMIQTLILTVSTKTIQFLEAGVWVIDVMIMVKGYVKSIAEDGTIVWFTTEEQTNLDISSLESWQIIRYTSEELEELNA